MNKLISVLSLSGCLFLLACAQEAKVSDKQAAKEQAVAQQEDLTGKQNRIEQEVIKAELAQGKTVKAQSKRVRHDSLNQVQEQLRVSPALASASQFAAQRHMPPQPMPDRENYSVIKENGIKLASEVPVSTFSIDVDTASYANVRRILNQGKLPRHDAVRVEELINYFSYDYPQPETLPFSVMTEVGPSPFNSDKHLLHIGIQGKQLSGSDRPAANLVFLIDVSGSMRSANKLGLLKNSLKMLTRQLNKKDSVAIVVYAGAAGTVLEPTAGNDHYAITDALQRLSAGGSTNGGAGIAAAYRLAEKSFIKSGINRVILATDGDFNLGTVNQQALKNMIESYRQSGVSLSVLGFGTGNYNDALMQELAQNGNGNAYYIDTLNEARKVLVEDISATLLTIAKDVKIQVEFNPALVREYRLVGYETRALNREDFNNDKIDAGEIGAGHRVTAIYEISLTDAKNQGIDPLRYQKESLKEQTQAKQGELAYLKLRFKQAEQDNSQLLTQAIKLSQVKKAIADTSESFRFSAAVAGFGQLLRGGKNLSTMDLDDVIELAQVAKGRDKLGYKGEFIQLAKLASALSPVQKQAKVAQDRDALAKSK